MWAAGRGRGLHLVGVIQIAQNGRGRQVGAAMQARRAAGRREVLCAVRWSVK